MNSTKITAFAHPNIAFIKYWGNRDDYLRLPTNGSISMNLSGLETCTSVSFDSALPTDRLSINGVSIFGPALDRVSQVLNLVRQMVGVSHFAYVESTSNFPTGAGMASSASAFAALALASSRSAGLDLSESELSRLARRGSGSACRSVPGGFVEWNAGEGDLDSFASTFAPASHWDLVDCIAVVSPEHKTTGSTRGNSLAGSSPLQAARVVDAPRRLAICRQAILQRDFFALARVAELDSNMLHAVMMTSTPPLFYWQPSTLLVMLAVREAREKGLPVFYTVDAGPNVHVLTHTEDSSRVENLLRNISGVQDVCVAGAGGPAWVGSQ
jgi:diphosphomevalonate decarboxylase